VNILVGDNDSVRNAKRSRTAVSRLAADGGGARARGGGGLKTAVVVVGGGGLNKNVIRKAQTTNHKMYSGIE
jgi:hypothetical protein